MADRQSQSPVGGSWLGHLRGLTATAWLRLLAAFGLALVGMCLLAGWGTDSSLVWPPRAPRRGAREKAGPADAGGLGLAGAHWRNGHSCRLRGGRSTR